jgi:hypothetical protein
MIKLCRDGARGRESRHRKLSNCDTLSGRGPIGENHGQTWNKNGFPVVYRIRGSVGF